MNALQVIFLGAVLVFSVVGCSVGSSYENAVNSKASSATVYESYEGDSSELKGLYQFDYDSSDLDLSASSKIRLLAKEIRSDTSIKLRVEGHCDERGTREYNLALGERRAQTVADILIVNGVKSQNITVVSYGEEKPLSTSSGNTEWAQNRRVEVKVF